MNGNLKIIFKLLLHISCLGGYFHIKHDRNKKTERKAKYSSHLMATAISFFLCLNVVFEHKTKV